MTVDTLPTARWTAVEWKDLAGAMASLGLEPHSGISTPDGIKAKKTKPNAELAQIARLVAKPDRLLQTAFTTAGMGGIGTTRISWREEDESIAVWAVTDKGIDIGVLADGVPAILLLDDILAISNLPARAAGERRKTVVKNRVQRHQFNLQVRPCVGRAADIRPRGGAHLTGIVPNVAAAFTIVEGVPVRVPDYAGCFV